MAPPLTIAAAQPATLSGEIGLNGIAHAAAIRSAGARVVVFPEMSLTGYELDATAIGVDDPRLRPIVEACAETASLAFVGAPVDGPDGRPSIGMLAIDGVERLFVFVILGLGRRRLLWIGVTTNPTAEWLARQITEAFPWNTVPGFLIRDNDGAYGEAFTRRLRAMGIRDRPIAPRSPWQNGYVERLIGSIRRECLDHVIIWGEAHLRQVLKAYTAYYNATRTHLGIDKDAPNRRSIERSGVIVANAVLGGLHHRYARI